MDTRLVALLACACSAGLFGTSLSAAGVSATNALAGAAPSLSAQSLGTPSVPAIAQETVDRLQLPLVGSPDARNAGCLIPGNYEGPVLHVRGGCRL